MKVPTHITDNYHQNESFKRLQIDRAFYKVIMVVAIICLIYLIVRTETSIWARIFGCPLIFGVFFCAYIEHNRASFLGNFLHREIFNQNEITQELNVEMRKQIIKAIQPIESPNQNILDKFLKVLKPNNKNEK